ncbi:MAG: hypothetical protein ACTSUE_04010, partial [Promethearchaeota archaeon]
MNSFDFMENVLLCFCRVVEDVLRKDHEDGTANDYATYLAQEAAIEYAPALRKAGHLFFVNPGDQLLRKYHFGKTGGVGMKKTTIYGIRSDRKSPTKAYLVMKEMKIGNVVTEIYFDNKRVPPKYRIPYLYA